MWFSSSFLFRFFYLYCVFLGWFFYPMSVLCLLTTYHVSNTRHGWGEMHAHSDFVLFKSRQVRDTQVNVLVTPSVTARKRSTLHRLIFQLTVPDADRSDTKHKSAITCRPLPFRKITHGQGGAVVFTRHELHAHSQISSWTLSVDKVQGPWVNIQQVPVEEKGCAQMLESLRLVGSG